MGGECSGWAVARRGGSGLNARGGHTTRKDDAEYDVGARFLPFDGNNAHEATPSESVASCALHKVGWGGAGGRGVLLVGWRGRARFAMPWMVGEGNGGGVQGGLLQGGEGGG